MINDQLIKNGIDNSLEYLTGSSSQLTDTLIKFATDLSKSNMLTFFTDANIAHVKSILYVDEQDMLINYIMKLLSSLKLAGITAADIIEFSNIVHDVRKSGMLGKLTVGITENLSVNKEDIVLCVLYIMRHYSLYITLNIQKIKLKVNNE